MKFRLKTRFKTCLFCIDVSFEEACNVINKISEVLSMVENVFKLKKSSQKLIEKVIMDENIHYMHMVFGKDDSLPTHFTNSNVYMTVLRGNLSIDLNEKGFHDYESGTVLTIPLGTRMTVKNKSEEVLEITVVKAPAPKE